MSRRRLGRGLASLIPDDVMEPVSSSSGSSVQKVPLSSIRANPEQPRTEFDAAALEELSRSIEEHGVLMPLLVAPSDDGFLLIAGERRLRASALAGLAEVPVVIHRGSTAPEIQLELALVENLQREDLNPIEEARGYERLQQDYGYTQQQIARKVGKERSTVANALRLLRHGDEVLGLVREGRLTTGHAKALLPMADHSGLRTVVAQVLRRGLSVRATEALVRAQTAGRRSAKKSERPDRAVEAVSNLLSRELSTGVELKPKGRGKGGAIVIAYYSDEELERLIKLLRTGAEGHTSGL